MLGSFIIGFLPLGGFEIKVWAFFSIQEFG
jgi:hypothetical protein